MWPSDTDALLAAQHELADARPEPWAPGDGALRVGGCWVCFPRGLTGPGAVGDAAWAAAAVLRDGAVVAERVGADVADAPYVPGLLALRVGRIMEATVRGLAVRPDVLLLDATGRDHPRGAGLAVHLGAVLDLPTVGVTHRPLVAEGEWPEDRSGATSPLRVGTAVVGCWLRTRAGTRPLAVHPGWRVEAATAVDVIRAVSTRRTPEPLRRSRYLARSARVSAGRG